MLLRNEGNGADGIPRYVDVAMPLGADEIYDARGIALLDYDNDGDLDIAVNHSQGDNPRDEENGVPVVLQRNDVGQRRSWLAIELEGRRSNRQGVGAQVTVVAGGRRQVAVVAAGGSYASQHGDRLYFGLGEAEAIDLVEVRWPAGTTEQFEGISPGTLVRIVEGEGPRIGRLPVLQEAAPSAVGGR